MEEDDNANTTVEDDGTNTLIHETFGVGMDDHDDFGDVHDIPLLEKERQPLYQGSKKSLLSTILLLVNLKVVNCF